MRHPPIAVSGQREHWRTFVKWRPASSPGGDFFRRLSCAGKESNQGKSLTINDLPCPPLEKLIYPGLCSWTRGVLKKIHYVVPEKLIVEVAVHGAPGGDGGKCESDLRISVSQLVEGRVTANLASSVRDRARSHLSHAYDGGNASFYLSLVWSPLGASVVLKNIGTITFAIHFIGRGGRCKYRLEPLRCN